MHLLQIKGDMVLDIIQMFVYLFIIIIHSNSSLCVATNRVTHFSQIYWDVIDSKILYEVYSMIIWYAYVILRIFKIPKYNFSEIGHVRHKN